MKRQWMHRAMKNWGDAKDAQEKNRLAWIIKENNLHHFPLFDQTIFINKTDFTWTKEHPTGYQSKEELARAWAVFMPDLFFPLRKTIIEIDGSFHFNSEKGVKRTKLRNQYYEYAGLKLITVTPEDMKEISDDELLTFLKQRLSDA